MFDNAALYFPSIEFQSSDWLKASLLAWDAVYRIVPRSHQPQDPREIREAADAGLVRNVVLEEEDLQNTLESFQGFLAKLATLPHGFEPSSTHTRVHIDKIDERLYPVLEKLSAHIAGEWLELPQELARGYMLYLAREVGKRRALSLATDNPDAWIVSSFIGETGNFADYVMDRGAPGQYCYVSFRHFIPVDVGQVPMKRIIRLSQEAHTDKEQFRQVANAFLLRLSACESEEHARQLVEDFRSSLAERIQALREHMKFWNSGGLSALLAVGVPTSIAALGTLATLAGTPTGSGLLASLSIGFVAAMASRVQLTVDNSRDRVASYLLEVDKGRALRDAVPNFGYLMNEFIND